MNRNLRRALAGAYEVLGDDDYNLVAGDDLAEILAMGGADAAQQILGRNAALVKEVEPSKARRFPLGFESAGTVAAGASVTIISRPQVMGFRGERLVVPSDIAGDFTIDDVKVGKNSQFVAEGPIPARVLQEDAIDVFFQLDTAQTSQDITLSVTNVSGAARQFRAALIGKAVE